MPRPLHLLAGLAAAACLAAAGCGDSSSDDKAAAPTAGETTASAKPAAFPSSQGKTLVSLRQGLTEGPILAAGVSLLDVGRNRFTFALIDRARKQLTGAEVAVYVSDPEGGNVEGPFEAHSESLAVDKRFQSKTTAQDPQAPESVYIVDLPFRRKGPGARDGHREARRPPRARPPSDRSSSASARARPTWGRRRSASTRRRWRR